jgi:hypothetical protein
MSVWFVRSNGETLHNQPDSPRFVPREPPIFPERTFDHRDLCLRDGFVRVGWPAVGDLRLPGWHERALNMYVPYWDSRYQRYLEQFGRILTGDTVLLPSGLGQYSVHIGVVVLRDVGTRRIRTVRPRLPAYSYHHDVGRGDWFENAHRVDVLWDADVAGVPGVHHVPGLGGLWRRAFGAVGAGANDVKALARTLGLPVSK